VGEEAAPSPSTGTSPSGSSKKRVRARAEEPDAMTADQDPLLDDGQSASEIGIQPSLCP
jgi:hypothetical protein